MGIATLEENYQRVIQNASIDRVQLLRYANRARAVQQEMREIFKRLSPHPCPHCERSCCEGAPVDGWFSLVDYVLFRLKYGIPNLPTNSIGGDGVCSFLTPAGCSLPGDMRPFSCVKVNCEVLGESLNALGEAQRFRQLKDELDDIQWAVYQLITSTNRIFA